MEPSSLPFPPDLVEFLRLKMSTGEYTSENEVVCEALTFLRERDRVRGLRLEELRRDVQVGIGELDRGESRPFDASEIKAEIRKRYGSR